MSEFLGCKVCGRFGSNFVGEFPNTRFFVEATGQQHRDALAPVVQARAIVIDMIGGAIRKREMCQEESLGMKFLDGVQRRIPTFDRNVRRRGRRKNERMSIHRNSSSIADKGCSFLFVEVRDVVRSVSRRV